MNAEATNVAKPARKKKKAGGLKPKQLRIEGTYDKPPKELADAVGVYADARKKKQKADSNEKAHRETCLALMQKHDIERVEIDPDWDLVLEHVDQVRKKRKPKRAIEAGVED